MTIRALMRSLFLSDFINSIDDPHLNKSLSGNASTLSLAIQSLKDPLGNGNHDSGVILGLGLIGFGGLFHALIITHYMPSRLPLYIPKLLKGRFLVADSQHLAL